MKKHILILSYLLTGTITFAQHDHDHDQKGKEKTEKTGAQVKDSHLNEALVQYLRLKDDLVKSDPEKAQKTATVLVKALAKVEKGNEAKLEASKIESSKSLKDQREAFASLSEEMVKLVKNSGLANGELYLEYCPMANGNEGASWLAAEPEINNPYFGNKMLHCGKVKEKIN